MESGQLTKFVKERKELVSQALLHGVVENYEHFSKLRGRLSELCLIEEEIAEILKKMEQED